MSSAATTPKRPQIETLEDLWCFLNIWGKLLTYVPRSNDKRLSESWRKGYEQAIRDAMDGLEAAGVTWDSVQDETWHKWSRA